MACQLTISFRCFTVDSMFDILVEEQQRQPSSQPQSIQDLWRLIELAILHLDCLVGLWIVVVASLSGVWRARIPWCRFCAVNSILWLVELSWLVQPSSKQLNEKCSNGLSGSRFQRLHTHKCSIAVTFSKRTEGVCAVILWDALSIWRNTEWTWRLRTHLTFVEYGRN